MENTYEIRLYFHVNIPRFVGSPWMFVNFLSDHKPVAALLSMPAWYQAPGTSNKPSRAVFTFRNVSAVNLIASDMMTGYSDPYIHFPRQPLLDTFHDSDWVGKVIIHISSSQHTRHHFLFL